MDNVLELKKSIHRLGDYQFIIIGSPDEVTEDFFDDNIKWVVGKDERENAIFGDKPSEVTWAKAKAEMDKIDYVPKRVEAYPSWQEQLDKMYHDGFDAWKVTIKEVKDAHPKP